MNFDFANLTDDELRNLINTAIAEREKREEDYREEAREMLKRCLKEIEYMGFYVELDDDCSYSRLYIDNVEILPL